MAFDNTIVLVGNVTRDPELRFTPGGAAVRHLRSGVEPPHAPTARPTRPKNRSTSSTSPAGASWPKTWPSPSPRACASSSTAGLQQRSWESAPGERRSKVEVIADEIAPSLKFATAQITRNDFRGGDGERSGGGGGGGGGGGRPVPNEPVYDPDEEPF